MTPEGSPRRSGGRHNTAVALGVLALLGAALLIFALTSQNGAPPQPELRSSTSMAPPMTEGGGRTDADGSATEVSAAPSTSAVEPSGTDRPAASSEPAPAPLPESAPSTLSIDALGLEEGVFPIGLGEDGELLTPSGDRANLPAWFEGSPTPGESGPSVIEGHVTWGGEPSIFFELGALGPGDRVDVVREDGRTATFEVYDAARYSKDEFPTLAVYGRTDGPELRLITCGGDLDADGHHLDNTVVFARLVES